MAKIKIDRDGCISCGACWGACPEIYEQNAEDEKSQIVGKFRVAENIAEGSLEGTLVECAQQGADGCPVQVISLD